jgi:hypothetical protein
MNNDQTFNFQSPEFSLGAQIGLAEAMSIIDGCVGWIGVESDDYEKLCLRLRTDAYEIRNRRDFYKRRLNDAAASDVFRSIG